MKKVIVISLAALALTALGYAQNQGNTPGNAPENKPKIQQAQPATPATPAMPEKKEMKKYKVENVVGEVVNVNEVKNQAGAVEKIEITVKTKAKGKKDAEEKVFTLTPDIAAGLKAGDKVKIKLVDGEVKNVKQIKEKKHEQHEKKEMKKEERHEKKEMKGKNEATPAQPAGN